LVCSLYEKCIKVDFIRAVIALVADKADDVADGGELCGTELIKVLAQDVLDFLEGRGAT